MSDNTDEVQEIPNSQRNCVDCRHCINPNDPVTNLYCEATGLSEVLDSLRGQNTIAPCNSVRDFKVACGHAAKWFQPR